jgi:putative ABC transport system permease protein
MPFRMPEKPDEIVGTGFKIITPGYFQALGLPLRAGRYFDSRDTAGSPHVVVVNEAFVKRYYPDGNAVGKHILVKKILPTRRGLGRETSWEIVGVVVDEKGRGLENNTDIGAYASFAQNPVVGLGIVAWGAGDSGALIQAVAKAVTRVDKTQALERARTVDELKVESTMQRRLTASLPGGLAVLALLLACAGLYGVLSFVTARRRHEMGIRTALGATRAALMRLVVTGGAYPVMLGILAGIGGAVGLTRYIQSMLFATDAIDIPTLAGVSALFLAVAMAACLVPAWRAARVDPMASLREE